MTLRDLTRRRRRNPTGKAPPRPKLPEGKAAGEPEKKGERLRRLVASEDWPAALKLAASLPLVPEPDRTDLQRAWEALSRPDFARELGRDPAALVEAGKAALVRRFGPKASPAPSAPAEAAPAPEPERAAPPRAKTATKRSR